MIDEEIFITEGERELEAWSRLEAEARRLEEARRPGVKADRRDERRARARADAAYEARHARLEALGYPWPPETGETNDAA